MVTGKTPILAAMMALALTACQSDDDVRMAAAPRPVGVEGQWSAIGGPLAYTATFNNGRFASVETATGGVLATGTYRNLGPGQINILYTSRLKNTEQSANCNLVRANRLACAASNGTRFEFARS
ncbi:hypothetical protein LQ948_13295 [Jiella sp. MQZ9-1]|uniref:Outer membrane lipoprotein n=1 Tax=Jiella flava TaxID=2816857 RepID=A0A939FY45_9HYPH|nr:hypothetical protein [Jiella flava]MBO0663612.1 hypothetical protein [Jiella flava]MCD2472187.1 hypothetical protein [Jiella flava]